MSNVNSFLVESKRKSKQFFGQIQKQFSSSFLDESRSNFQAVLWPNPEAIFQQFFGRIQKQFSSSSLAESRIRSNFQAVSKGSPSSSLDQIAHSNLVLDESRSNFQAVLWPNLEAIFKQFFGRIQMQFSSCYLAKSRSNFQAVLWPNPAAIFGRKAEIPGIFFFFFAFFDCFIYENTVILW